jgi:hypothetical protein
MIEPNAQIEFEVLCDQYYEATGENAPGGMTAWDIECFLKERNLDI